MSFQTGLGLRLFSCGVVCLLTESCNSHSPMSAGAASSVAPAPASFHSATPDRPTARPIYPPSGATLLGSNVVFRWTGEQAHVELARERSFRSIAQRSPVGGVSGLVLRAGRGIWFWRVVDATGRVSAVWGFDVTADAPALHAPSVSLATDYNGDLLADLSVKYGVLLGRAGKLQENPLTTLAVGTLKIPELIQAATDQPYTWNVPEPTGDVNGDGYADMTALVARQSSTRVEDNVPVRLFFQGGPDIHTSWVATSRISHGATAIGDVNDDGYADVGDCGSAQDTHCGVFVGSPNGLGDRPLFELPDYDRLLGGADLDGDAYPDLLGIAKDGSIAFYAGPLTAAPSAPTLTWKVPLPSSRFVGLADLDSDGHVDLWGKGSTARDSEPGFSDAHVWMISGKGIASGKPLQILGSFKREVNDDMAFIPGVGKPGTGILVRSTDLRNDFGFAQESFPFALRPRSSVKPKLPSDLSEVSLQSIGDFNGDGFDDLLVTRASAGEDVVSEVYLGGAEPFTMHPPSSPSDVADPLSGGFMSGGPARSPF